MSETERGFFESTPMNEMEETGVFRKLETDRQRVGVRVGDGGWGRGADTGGKRHRVERGGGGEGEKQREDLVIWDKN